MIIRIFENKVYKIETDIKDDLFLEMNKTGGFKSIESLPFSNFNKWKIVNNEIEECTGNYLSGNELAFTTNASGQLMLTYRANDDEYYSIVLK